jgi:cytochrome c
VAEVVASKSGVDWTDYKWPTPVTKQIEQKTSFTKRLQGMAISCGVYK